MRRWLAAQAASFLVAASAFGVTITYQTTLNGANEFPVNPSTATGTATAIYDSTAHTLALSVTWNGLTGNATAAHIHCCVAPFDANPLAGIAIGATGFPAAASGTYNNTFDLTLTSTWNSSFLTANGGTPAGAEGALAANLAIGYAYFNIHTSGSPGGEIRGFFVAVPEPSIAILGGTAAILLAARRRIR